MLVSAIEGHRIWAPTYDSGANPLLAVESRALESLVTPSAITLDVACGTGRWAQRLGGFGVDLSAEMLQEAARKPALRGRMLRTTASALPFASNSSDLTICSFAIGYIQELRAAVSEMARVTRSGGHVVVTDLHPAAIAAGWTRSFRVDGKVYDVEHRTTAVPETLEAARDCGLLVQQQQSVCFAEPERPIFDAAGKADAFEELARTPAVWIGVWKKP